MKQIAFLFFMLSSVMFADYLYSPLNLCVEKYWFADGAFYYVRSDNHQTLSIQTTDVGNSILNGYDYNATSLECTPKSSNNDLDMRDEDFNLLNAEIALVVCALLFWSLL